MKKAKNGKKDKTFKPDSPVTYNRSIMAAFDKQSKGKICQLCNAKFSLAAYRAHLDACQIDENDSEIEVLATYTREEAINLRAGPEIVIGEEEIIDFLGEKPESIKTPKSSQKLKHPTKRRRTEEEKLVEKAKTPEAMVPFSFDSPQASKTPENHEDHKNATKSASESENRRRSRRIAQKTPEVPIEVVKKETATISEVLDAIKRFEVRMADSNQKWPYYMKLAVKIMKKVISTRKSDGTYYSDDFWRLEDVISMWRFMDRLSGSAKCILMRLVIRRPGWYPLDKLETRYPEIPYLSEAVVELIKWEFVDDESSLKDLDEAIALADLTILKNVARKFKLDVSKNRLETVQLLKKFAQSQKSIFGGVGNVEASILRSLKQELGCCVQIRQPPVILFKSLYTVYCPMTTNSAVVIDSPGGSSNPYSDLIFVMSELESGKIRFPGPNPNENIASFYKDRSMLTSYVTAKSIETTLVTFMSNGKLAEALDLAIDSKEFIDNISADIKEYCQSLEVHERKFTAIWVLTRCIAHGATVLERQKKWGMAVEWHRNLLMGQDYKGYCLDSRGIWWDRMLLNLDSHLKEKKECANMVLLAMEDPHVLEKELLLIQDRALKLKDFPEFKPKISIGIPEKRTISAPTISKNLGDGRVNRFVIRDDDKEENVECSVEEVVRRRYLKDEGFTDAVHDEGATWHTLFGLLFYDVIFNSTDSHTSNTWFSEIQDCPADMANTLYSKRSGEFEKRFEWMRMAKDEELEAEIEQKWTEKCGENNKECNWNLFKEGVGQVLSFYHCIPRPALLEIFRRLAMNYRNCRSGFPDLTMWNPKTKQVAVVEVKGPGDRLSTKQRLWLAFFAKFGIRAEVCHVTAESSKRLS